MTLTMRSIATGHGNEPGIGDEDITEAEHAEIADARRELARRVVARKIARASAHASAQRKARALLTFVSLA